MVEAGIPHFVYLKSSPLPVPRANNHWSKNVAMGLPWWLSGGVTVCQGRRRGFKPWSRKTPHARGQVSPRSAAGEPVLSSPGAASTEPTAETPEVRAPGAGRSQQPRREESARGSWRPARTRCSWRNAQAAAETSTAKDKCEFLKKMLQKSHKN